MGGGKCDLVYPEEKTIIETKIWRGEQAFEDGITQLQTYLRAQEYTLGHLLTFYRGAKNAIANAHPEEIFPVHTDDGAYDTLFYDPHRSAGPFPQRQTEKKCHTGEKIDLYGRDDAYLDNRQSSLHFSGVEKSRDLHRYSMIFSSLSISILP